MRRTWASRPSPRLGLGVPIVRPHGPWRGTPANLMCHRARETGRHRYAVPHPMPPKGVGFPDPLSGTLKSAVPLKRRLENKSRDAVRRPDFTLPEYRRLYRALRAWINRGRNGKSRQMRELLRDYVLILANTGIRHGTEAQNLKWRNVSTFVGDDGHSYLAMWVDGKTGGVKLWHAIAACGILNAFIKDVLTSHICHLTSCSKRNWTRAYFAWPTEQQPRI
jgi:hypothetical protein